MSQNFNPYREWLGVTSSSASPSYYELLGLRPLEADIAKINAAYQRQSSQLAARLSGNQADLAQRLMGEIAEARMTLMTPTAKRAYDQALAAHSPTPPAPSAGDVQEMLPPAASGHGVAPGPVVVPGAAGYVAPQAYPVSQGQAGMAAPQASPVVPTYYVPPQAVASAAVVPVQPQPAEGLPTIRRRPARRRSSSLPALFITAVVVVGILGAMWFYFKGDKTVVMLASGQGETRSTESVPSTPTNQPADPKQKAVANTKEHEVQPPAIGDARIDTQDDPAAATSTESPTAMPDSMDDGATPEAEKASPEERENAQPKPSEASPEETAAVAKSLKEVRAALAVRDLPKAKDLLDEATIEATAPDMLAQVNQVETLTRYVEMFWDAARKTLPKLQAAETIEIDGKEVAIVDADENHLIVRIEGSSHEYAWTKIPAKIARYLANRWLAPNDPARNLVLAAFEIVEPKGDLAQAKKLLDAASAARLNAKPLYAELKMVRGG